MSAPAIYVDADACPVKEEVIRVAGRHGLVVRLVGNQWSRAGLGAPNAERIERVVVAEGSDAADDWIADRIAAGDIAVTQDIRLAARCLAKGAAAIGPTGRAFTDANIGAAVAMRELNNHLRDTGAIRGGGPSFAAKDRSRFLEALEQAVRRALTDTGRKGEP